MHVTISSEYRPSERDRRGWLRSHFYAACCTGVAVVGYVFRWDWLLLAAAGSSIVFTVRPRVARWRGWWQAARISIDGGGFRPMRFADLADFAALTELDAFDQEQAVKEARRRAESHRSQR